MVQETDLSNKKWHWPINRPLIKNSQFTPNQVVAHFNRIFIKKLCMYFLLIDNYGPVPFCIPHSLLLALWDKYLPLTSWKKKRIFKFQSLSPLSQTSKISSWQLLIIIAKVCKRRVVNDRSMVLSHKNSNCRKK